MFLQSLFTKPKGTASTGPVSAAFTMNLVLTAILYASAAVPLFWDQGVASTITSLKAFEVQFGINSATATVQIRTLVGLVWIGASAGAASSFFIDDRIGRRWAFRLWVTVWFVGYMLATFAPNAGALYASRIIAGWGCGGLTVVGPVTLAELAPPQIRGLLTAWYSVASLLALMCGNFATYGVESHVASGKIQYQILFFAPCAFMVFPWIASFFVVDSPRWLAIVGRHDEGISALATIRQLSVNDTQLKLEYETIALSVEGSQSRRGYFAPFKTIFGKSSNTRRLRQVLLLYALPQLSGGNSITTYLLPIVKIIGAYENTKHGLFIAAMYAMAKFFFGLIVSFILIDGIGRRRSLFLGITCQMVSFIYLAVYIHKEQVGPVSLASGRAALAFIFVAAWGYAAGLLILPYVLGGEIWPNEIRVPGAALCQVFHWLFIFAMTYAVPSMLTSFNNWGGFVFFSAWCFISLVYVYFFVPEISGVPTEQMDDLFKGSQLVHKHAGEPLETNGLSMVKTTSRLAGDDIDDAVQQVVKSRKTAEA